MGEYATCGGRRIKIGTCEDMLYLRWDQHRAITASDVDFNDPAVLEVVRFRFPWPDEDGNTPGAFEDPFRGMPLWGAEVPAEVEHGLVQFKASNGYLVSLPCPEGPEPVPYTVHRNGYGGACSLVAQAWRAGRLVGIARCNGCEHAYRLEDGHEQAAAVAIRSQADEQIRTAEKNGTEGNRVIGERFHVVADRLLAGYELEGVRG